MHYLQKSSVISLYIKALLCITMLVYAYSVLKLWWNEDLKFYLINNYFKEEKVEIRICKSQIKKINHSKNSFIVSS